MGIPEIEQLRYENNEHHRFTMELWFALVMYGLLSLAVYDLRVRYTVDTSNPAEKAPEDSTPQAGATCSGPVISEANS